MFSLLLVVCLGSSVCQYAAPEAVFATEHACQRMAPMAAGRIAASWPPSPYRFFRFACTAVGTDATTVWYEFQDGSPTPIPSLNSWRMTRAAELRRAAAGQ